MELSTLKLPFYDPKGGLVQYDINHCFGGLASLRNVTVAGRRNIQTARAPDEVQRESCASLAGWIGDLPALEQITVEHTDDLNSEFLVTLLAKAHHLKRIDISSALDRASWAALAACPSANQVEVLRFRGLCSNDLAEVDAFTRALHRLGRLREIGAPSDLDGG